MKNTLSIIDDVIANPLFNNYFTRQLRQIVESKGLDIVCNRDNLLSYIQSDEEYRQQSEEPNFGYTGGETGIQPENADPVVQNQLHTVELTPIEDKESVHLNYNLYHLSISNFRKFPTKNGIGYGLNLVGDLNRKPLSTILYGGNGCGKSSLFDALRYLYLDLKSDFPYKSLHFAKDNHQDIHVHAVVSTGHLWATKKSTEKATLSINAAMPADIRDVLEAFFCSESDINQIINDKSLKEYIYRQIGFGGAYRLFQFLEKLYSEATESTRNIDIIDVREDDIDDSSPQNDSLSSDILYMEEGLADTYSLIQYLKEEDNKKSISTALEALHKPINLSYDPIADDGGKLTDREKIVRFRQLKNELKDTIETLKQEKQKLTRVRKLYTCKLLDIYDQLIALFEGIDPDNEKDQHLVVMSHFFANLKQFTYTEAENRLVYHIERIKRIIELKSENKDDSAFFMTEVRDLVKLHTDLTSKEEKQKELSNKQKLSDIASLLYDFLQKYHEVFTSRVNAVIAPMRDTIETILQDFDMDSDEVKVVYDDTNSELKILYQFRKDDCSAPVLFTPQEYLNSFRLKLYGISVKIALAFAFMKSRNFTFPLVFDDVFYASDFNNRKGVKEFVRHILECYNRQCDSKIPLQLIFLTHDDVVFDAMAEAFPDRNDYIQGLLFDYRDVEESDLVNVKGVQDDKKQFELSYYNVYVRK